jgi:uncharacterized protein (TIGR02266 family)
MADQSGAKPPAPDPRRAVLTTDQVRAFTDRAPRCTVRVAVICQPPGLPDVVETQLVNVSRSGMFLASRNLLEIGTVVEFQYSLDDGVVVLQGTAEVMRVSEGTDGERGMGLRFTALDEESRRMVDRIVEVNSREPPASGDTPGAGATAVGKLVTYGHGSLRIVLSAATAPYFTYNPLLHIGIGGCFVPAASDVPLGTGYQLDIVDAAGHLLLRCKAKVAAKQEQRIGIRLIDVERDALLRLRAEIAKLAPTA